MGSRDSHYFFTPLHRATCHVRALRKLQNLDQFVEEHEVSRERFRPIHPRWNSRKLMKDKIVAYAVTATVVFSSHLALRAGIQWEKSFGGTDADAACVVKPTSDGGYILGGYSYSDISGAKSTPNYGLGDYWMVKLDASGNKQWDRSLGGTQFDGLTAIHQTSDGGYILGGISFSDPSGIKTSGNYGAGDFWIARLNASGTKQWDKSFGGTNLDTLTALKQTSDGGYILGGTSFSAASGNKTSASIGSDSGDYWIVKLDANGNKQWEKSFGGNDLDELRSLQQTSDGGYIIGGFSTSTATGNKTSVNLGSGTSDYWVLKLDASGNKQWERAYGGSDADELYALQQTSDGGYILGGHSYSGVSGNKSSGNFGSYDYWIVKLNASGTKEWDKSFGGDNEEKLRSVEQRGDGGYILGGVSLSGISGNKTGISSAADSADYWILNLDANGNKQSEQSIARSYADDISGLQATPDTGCVLNGKTNAMASADVDFSITKLTGLLRISSSTYGSDRIFRAKVGGVPGTSYALQMSTNFVTWKALATNTAANGIVNFSDITAASSTRRFYRVQQLP
jgi:hypothetical protein